MLACNYYPGKTGDDCRGNIMFPVKGNCIRLTRKKLLRRNCESAERWILNLSMFEVHSRKFIFKFIKVNEFRVHANFEQKEKDKGKRKQGDLGNLLQIWKKTQFGNFKKN